MPALLWRRGHKQRDLTEAVDRVLGKSYACEAFAADLAAKLETRSAVPRSWSGGVGSQQDRGRNRTALREVATVRRRVRHRTIAADDAGTAPAPIDARPNRNMALRSSWF
jgi:hypothetical protein